MHQRTASTTTTARRPATLLSLGAVAALALSACAGQDSGAEGDGETASSAADSAALATAAVQDGDGQDAGTAEFTETDGGMEISVDLENLEPGHHGLHLHQVGECEPDSAAPDDPSDTGDFLSAGGHLNPDDAQHPDHAGDLPSILVQEDGTAQITFTTDRLAQEDLLDDDGTALMVHSDADNFANIPERYAPEGANEDSTSTGDAGDRAACGVVEEA